MKLRKSTQANQIGPIRSSQALHQLGQFWLWLLIGGVLWGGVLWLISHRIGAVSGSAETPLWLQNLYFAGLYFWLLLLIFTFRKPHWPRWPAWLAQALSGYALGTGLLLVFWLVFAIRGHLQIQAPTLNSLQILHAVLLGWLVASIEEAVFRGVTLELLGQRFQLLTALSGQALLYAGLHLLQPQAFSLSGLINLSGLFAVGWFLGLLRVYTGQLACSTGLHAGWISLSMLGAWSQALNWSPRINLWSGNGNPAQGLSGMFCFMLLSAWIWHLLPAHRQLWHNEAKRQ